MAEKRRRFILVTFFIFAGGLVMTAQRFEQRIFFMGEIEDNLPVISIPDHPQI
jgi:hypothetical protein